MRPRLSLLFFLLCAVSISACRVFAPRSASETLSKAEEALRQNQYDRAIALYQQHMQRRLKQEDRAEWENPYFYELMIGDIELKADKPDQALKSYQRAQEKQIDLALISDRYRYLASWYESKGQRKLALEILSRYRSLDPLLFDAMADRIAKDLVHAEEAVTPAPSPTRS